MSNNDGSVVDKISDNESLLWTGESVFCLCGHHLEYHYTKTLLTSEKIFFCNFTDKCPCAEFVPYKEIKQE